MPKKKITQNDRVLRYMRDFGSINPLQALGDLGVMRLASRISDLKDQGYIISKKMVKGQNRYGEPVTYARYRLIEETEYERQNNQRTSVYASDAT